MKPGDWRRKDQYRKLSRQLLLYRIGGNIACTIILIFSFIFEIGSNILTFSVIYENAEYSHCGIKIQEREILMELDQIMQMLKGKTEIKLVKFISDKGPNSCEDCLKHHGKIFCIDDPNKPELPIHPNCRCKYEPIDTSNKNTAMLAECQQIVNNVALNSNVTANDAMKIATQLINARSANSKIKNQPLFLLFNGSKLISSDGKLVLKAVSGVPVSKKQNLIKHQHWVPSDKLHSKHSTIR